jgi:hypothetical protein
MNIDEARETMKCVQQHLSAGRCVDRHITQCLTDVIVFLLYQLHETPEQPSKDNDIHQPATRILLTEYIGDAPGRPISINPEEISCIRSYSYHSFRPYIGEVILSNGVKIRTWETAEDIDKLVQRSTES